MHCSSIIMLSDNVGKTYFLRRFSGVSTSYGGQKLTEFLIIVTTEDIEIDRILKQRVKFQQTFHRRHRRRSQQKKGILVFTKQIAFLEFPYTTTGKFVVLVRSILHGILGTHA